MTTEENLYALQEAIVTLAQRAVKSTTPEMIQASSGAAWNLGEAYAWISSPAQPH